MGILRHVVLLNFVAGAPVTEIEEKFNALPSQIPVIRGYEWGLNLPDNDKNRGFTHTYFLTFDSDADLHSYEENPHHLEFKKFAGPYIFDEIIMCYLQNNF